MRIETNYICEICGLKWPNMQGARDCEERGFPPVYPVVTIFGDNRPGADYEKICFAVAKNFTHGHSNNGACWATRDNGSGDNLGEEYCQLEPLGEDDAHLNPEAPCTVRMVKWLRKQKHMIYVWTGEEAVELEL